MKAQSEIRSYIDGKKRPGTAAALTSQSDKLVSLFGQILEELGSIKAGEGLVDECLMTMITFSGQNNKLKNVFMQSVSD